MKLDAAVLRYLTRDDFRVLTAIEMGMKNHELVPTQLICSIAGLEKGPGAAFKIINTLHRNKLIYHECKSYDGYRLTYLGYDYLALRTYVARGLISGLGRRIGVGKEADIYECQNEAGDVLVLKIHRLGRISFRQIKNKRDYLLHRKNASWMYMSRLAAIREFTYMKALYDHGFPVPVPYDQSRHTILMSFVDAFPFGQVREISNTGKVYSELLNLIIKLAEHGLIHADFNEFNLLIDQSEKITLIDFPQMVSTNHPEAKTFFERDVGCITRYFTKRFGYLAGDFPLFDRDIDESKRIDLDKELEASGHAGLASFGSTEQRREFERMIAGKTDAAALQSATADDEDDDAEEPTEEQLAESFGVEASDLATEKTDLSEEDALKLQQQIDATMKAEEQGGKKGVSFASSSATKKSSKKSAAAAEESKDQQQGPDDEQEEAEEEEEEEDDDAARAARMARKDARQKSHTHSQALKAARKSAEKERKRREREGLPPVENDGAVAASASASSSVPASVAATPASIDGAGDESVSDDDAQEADDADDSRSIASSAASLALSQLGLSSRNVLNIQLPKVQQRLKKTNRNKNREQKKLHASIKEHL